MKPKINGNQRQTNYRSHDTFLLLKCSFLLETTVMPIIVVSVSFKFSLTYKCDLIDSAADFCCSE